MVGGKGSRMMRLLQRTSDYHQPGRVAAAVAIGVLAGLVPKSNLLSIVIYAALILLPVHTLLGLVVSAIVSCSAVYLTSMTHALGGALLEQPSLLPMWTMLDNTAIVPWFGLHNTVVLGSFVIGFVMLGPTYVIALRMFERACWGPARVSYRTIKTPRKVFGSPLTALAAASLPDEEEALEFEPVREVTAIIRGWHMDSPANVRCEKQSIGIDWGRERQAINSSVPAFSHDAHQRSIGRTEERDPPQPRRNSELVNSIDLAHSASEVLAWVDELLDECLADEGLPLMAESVTEVSRDLSFYAEEIKQPVAENESASPDPDCGEQWLMETTIEIVRWADDSPSEQILSELASNEPSPPETGSSELNTYEPSPSPGTSVILSMSMSLQIPACASTEMSSDVALSEPSPPQGFSMAHRDGHDMKSKTGFEHLVLAGTQNHGGDRHNVAIQPQRGECLGYLLGHLRQTRDGRTS